MQPSRHPLVERLKAAWDVVLFAVVTGIQRVDVVGVVSENGK